MTTQHLGPGNFCDQVNNVTTLNLMKVYEDNFSSFSVPVPRVQHPHGLPRLIVPQPDGLVPGPGGEDVVAGGETRDRVVVTGEQPQESDPVPRLVLADVPDLDVAADVARDDVAAGAQQRGDDAPGEVALAGLEAVPGTGKRELLSHHKFRMQITHALMPEARFLTKIANFEAKALDFSTRPIFRKNTRFLAKPLDIEASSDNSSDQVRPNFAKKLLEYAKIERFGALFLKMFNPLDLEGFANFATGEIRSQCSGPNH